MKYRWLSRLLIGIVTTLNLQAAVLFMLIPNRFVSSFEMTGETGNAVIQALGLLFLMWNVPYIFALIDPIKNRTSLIQANIMQAIGVIGETGILTTLRDSHPMLASSITRFIIFDASGLGLLLIALLISMRKNNQGEN